MNDKHHIVGRPYLLVYLMQRLQEMGHHFRIEGVQIALEPHVTKGPNQYDDLEIGMMITGMKWKKRRYHPIIGNTVSFHLTEHPI